MTEIAQEVAHAEFERMCNFARIDIAPDDEDDAGELDKVRATICRLICAGVITVDQSGAPTVQTNAGTFTFRIPDARALLATEEAKEKQNLMKLHLFISELTNTPRPTLGKLPLADYKALMAVGSLFFRALGET